jgi:hypothetical protein
MSEIKSQEEADRVRKYLVKATVKTLGITEKDANRRMDALLKSGILDRYVSPDSTIFQFVVDIAMRIPQIEIE